jgi:hypothetical protein
MYVSNRKSWLTSADGGVFRFSMPPEDQRGGYAFAGFFAFAAAMLLWLSFQEPQAAVLRWFIPGDFLVIGLLVYLFAPSQFTINAEARTYELVSRWPWGSSVRRGHLDDFRAVHVSDRGDVSLVFRRARPRTVVPLGRGGLGGDGSHLAREISQVTGLEVVTRL